MFWGFFLLFVVFSLVFVQKATQGERKGVQEACDQPATLRGAAVSLDRQGRLSVLEIQQYFPCEIRKSL